MSESIANRTKVSAIAREASAQSALQSGDENTEWQSAWSMAASINTRMSAPIWDSPPDPALLDIDMHDLWYMYWHGAVNTSPSSPKIDRLALQILQLKEQGTLTVATNDKANTSPVTTSDGALVWSDLPFLVQDMTAHWTTTCAALSSQQRLSGAEFLALLATSGASADNALCGIGLVMLREALETPRVTGRLTTSDQASNRQLKDLSVADLLPSANAWLFAAGRKMIQLSDAEWNRGLDSSGKLGALVLDQSNIAAGLESPPHEGFSPQRWVWWLRRLEQISSILTSAGGSGEDLDEESAELVRFVQGMMDNMILVAQQTNGAVAEILRKSDRPVGHQPVMQLLGPLPSTSGQPVGMADR